MARTVLRNNDEVAHHWAHQVSSQGRSGNMSYEGPVLYSYAAPIAILVDLPGKAGKAAVITGRRYSVTTSAHTSCARSAVFHLPRLMLPEGMGVWAAWHYAKGVDLRRAIRRQMAEHANELHREHSRKDERREFRSYLSRATSWEGYLSAAHKAAEFCEMAGLPTYRVADPDPETAASIRRINDRRDHLRRIRNEKDRLRHEEWERKNADRIAKARERLAAWLSGESRDRTDLWCLGESYLRISPSNPEEVETTKGATVPTEHVRRAAPVVLRILARGEEWHTNGKTIHLGHYRLDRIEADGTVVAGCHRFSRAEIERFAAVLGITVPSGADTITS